MAKKYIPLYNKVVVEVFPEKDERVTAAGIFIPGEPSRFFTGKVVSVGNGSYQNATRIKMDVGVNDVIVFLKGTGIALELDDTQNPKYVVLADNDIFAKVEETN